MVKEKNESNEISAYQKINKRRRVPIYFTDESLTQQNYKDESDINNIVKKYKTTGELPVQRQGYYGDASNVPDYQQALQIVEDAQKAFNELPSKIRGEFMNDPGTMLNWLTNPANRPRAVELGLIEGATSKIQPQPPEPKKDEKTIEKS